MPSHRIVLGLGYGDEGKGLTVDWLTRRSAYPVVVRFNGGCQAGHTVIVNGKRHVFSHFGSGTLAGAPTYWSRYCPVSPLGMIDELAHLRGMGIEPDITFDPRCPVTTWGDILANQAWERARGGNAHGSCGVGFGTTIARQESPYKLFVADFLDPHILLEKLKAIEKWYLQQRATWHRGVDDQWPDQNGEENTRFVEIVEELGLAKKVRLFSDTGQTSAQAYDRRPLILEGAQGILLDQDHGVFPHVTRSYTTARNALEFIREETLDIVPVETWYITRTYATRHGNGPLAEEDQLPLKNHENETNVKNEFQGSFRYGHLREAAIQYALNVNRSYGLTEEHMVVTCTDQHPMPSFLTQMKIRRWHAYAPHITRGPTALDFVQKSNVEGLHG